MMGATTLLSSGCGKNEKMSYDLTENGCATGKHEFDSKDAYCAGLKDEALNQGCASDLRQARVTADCS